ncbi:MAG: hypothetical protein JKP97_03415 [Rhodobacteraceae bacterium]|nr:hypothetical protein [Paracoccaceae bacterium]
MNAIALRRGTAILVVLAIGLLGLAAMWPVALKVIDEAIYYAAAHSLAESGSLIVANGWEQWGVDALRLRFMTAGPNGLAPQYPPGAAFLAAPLMPDFGMRALVLVNAVAAAATLFVTFALARAAFGRADVALGAALLLIFGTFWLEFTVGIWPHALATLCVTTALWASFRGLSATGYRGLWWAGAAGLATGAGAMVRVDSVLVLPALATATILFAPRHLLMLAAGIAGTLPAAGAMSLINQFKFGSWSPLSYGVAEGGVALTGHSRAIVVVLLALNALLLIRRAGWRPSRRALWLGAAVLAAGVAAWPPTREAAWAVLSGGYKLVADARLLSGPEIVDRPGTRYFWGLPKKALGQSMPWIGFLIALFWLPMKPADARAVAILAIACVLWILPFSFTAWYGGYGANMRYFLPVLPVLAVLGAWLWAECAERTGAGLSALIIGVISGAALLVGWYFLHPTGYGGTQQALPLILLGATAGTALAAGLAGPWRRFALRVTQSLVAMGFVTATALTAGDIRIDHWSRDLIADAVRRMATVPPDSLIYGRPELAPFQFGRPGLLALPAGQDAREAQLLLSVLEAGMPVYADTLEAERLIARGAPLAPTGPLLGRPESPFVELVPAWTDRPAATPETTSDPRSSGAP